jgi:hypothetical protein
MKNLEEKLFQFLFCDSQISHDLTWAGTLAAASEAVANRLCYSPVIN